MNAKNKFREGWIMLLRPFKFAELKKPLQKMTVLYAYSERPIIKMSLSETGQELYEDLCESWERGGKTGLHMGRGMYTIRFRETQEEYDKRMEKHLDDIFRLYSTQENYEGELVQCYVEGILCKFFPQEYSIISRETFEHLLTCNEEEYSLEIENKSAFTTKTIKDKLFYIQNRGINKSLAQKMVSGEMKDNVIFRPGPEILEMFCRKNEIY